MRISILTPSFNSAKYIEKAIKSVMLQDYPDWEHVVVDGCSTDGTLEILKRYPHLRWISEPDGGQSEAMNKAYTLSGGDIILYLNVDDSLEPGVFSRVINYYREHGECKFLVGDLNVLDHTHALKYRHSPATDLADILDLINLKFPLNPVSYYYRREVQDKVGPFPLDNHYSMDYWFLLRAYYDFRVDKIDDVMGNYVHTGENKSFSFVQGKSSLFNDLLDFLSEKNLLAAHKHFLVSCYENYLTELLMLRNETGARLSAYSNLFYRIERKIRNMIRS